MKTIKKTFSIIFFLSILLSKDFSQSFSGSAGINEIIEGEPLINQNFISIQLAPVDNFFIKTNFSVSTEATSIFSQNTNLQANAFLNEFSLSYYPESSNTNFFSLFVNSYDNIGTGSYLTKYLGLKDSHSYILDSFSGFTGNALYSMDGIGLGYTKKIKDFSLFSAYFHTDNNSSDFKFVTDFRYAIGLDKFSADTLLGLQINTEKTDGFIFAVKDAELKSAIELFYKKEDETEFYAQFALSNAKISTSEKFFNTDCFSAFFEYRLKLEQLLPLEPAYCNISLFVLPQDYSIDGLYFIKNKVGANIAILFESPLGKSFDLGMNLEVSGKDLLLSDIISDPIGSIENIDFHLIPFFDFDFNNGRLKSACSFNFTDPSRLFSFALGYKISF